MTQVVVWLNSAANLLGCIALEPIAFLPGWLSATLVAAGTGILALVVFKYTSNQAAIRQVRNDIRADLLALSLFKDNVSVCLRSQGRIFVSALKLLLLAVVPVLVMIGPMSLLLGQLALWYQARPLAVGEETVVTLRVSGDSGANLPEVRLEPTQAVEVALGPVRVQSERLLCWSLRAREKGTHRLAFHVADQTVEKELVIGDGFLRTSPVRPAWNWTDALLYPWERPFPSDAPVQSIAIDYPARDSWITGGKTWLVFWFLASMLTAIVCRPILNVHF